MFRLFCFQVNYKFHLFLQKHCLHVRYYKLPIYAFNFYFCAVAGGTDSDLETKTLSDETDYPDIGEKSGSLMDDEGNENSSFAIKNSNVSDEDTYDTGHESDNGFGDENEADHCEECYHENHEEEKEV